MKVMLPATLELTSIEVDLTGYNFIRINGKATVDGSHYAQRAYQCSEIMSPALQEELVGVLNKIVAEAKDIALERMSKLGLKDGE